MSVSFTLDRVTAILCIFTKNTQISQTLITSLHLSHLRAILWKLQLSVKNRKKKQMERNLLITTSILKESHIAYFQAWIPPLLRNFNLTQTSNVEISISLLSFRYHAEIQSLPMICSWGAIVMQNVLLSSGSALELKIRRRIRLFASI